MGNSLKVMLVDDEVTILKGLKGCLTGRPMAVKSSVKHTTG